MANNTRHIVGGGLGTLRKEAQAAHRDRINLDANRQAVQRINAVAAMHAAAQKVRPTEQTG